MFSLGFSVVMGSDEDRALALLPPDKIVLETIGGTGVVETGSKTNVIPDSFAVVVIVAAVVVLNVEDTESMSLCQSISDFTEVRRSLTATWRAVLILWARTSWEAWICHAAPRKSKTIVKYPARGTGSSFTSNMSRHRGWCWAKESKLWIVRRTRRLEGILETCSSLSACS